MTLVLDSRAYLYVYNGTSTTPPTRARASPQSSEPPSFPPFPLAPFKFSPPIPSHQSAPKPNPSQSIFGPINRLPVENQKAKMTANKPTSMTDV